MYHVGERVVLTASRDVLGIDEVRRRGEGVAILLSGEAVRAWKQGGSRWNAWSSRLVSATLKVGNGFRDRLHILSCYAPTFAASREDKNIFYATLQDALSAIPSDECWGTSMLELGLGMWMMSGGMKGVHMGTEMSMMLVEIYFLFCQPMKQQCATASLGSETFISRHGSTPSLGIGIALTMTSVAGPQEEVSGCLGDAWSRL